MRTGATPQAQATTARGVDREFSRLAGQVAGFGGMYYNQASKLVVFMKSQPGVAALRSGDVVGHLRSFGGPSVQRRLARAADVVVQNAAYDYGQLQGWKGRLNSKVFGVRGVLFTDIDEEHNRLRIGMSASASQPAVEQAIQRAGVPLKAVVMTRASITRLATLTDKVMPRVGGLQIFFRAPSQGPNVAFICTLGFNARLPEQPDQRFFVTASHCSDIQGGNQSTRYFQPLPGSTPTENRIAIEQKDPAYGNPGGLCAQFGPGFRCRLSDALLARYTSGGGDLGKIARTTFGLGRIGSLTIDPNHPRWRIVGEFAFPFQGETANKVGRSSGWTSGPVILTCADFGVTGTNIIQICQDAVLAGVRAGDSGSPVFERAGGSSSDVFLTGVLWGGGTLDGVPIFVFSAMENIEFELGELTTEVLN